MALNYTTCSLQLRHHISSQVQLPKDIAVCDAYACWQERQKKKEGQEVRRRSMAVGDGTKRGQERKMSIFGQKVFRTLAVGDGTKRGQERKMSIFGQKVFRTFAVFVCLSAVDITHRL